MAASQSFHADLDVLMLATNLIKKVFCGRGLLGEFENFTLNHSTKAPLTSPKSLENILLYFDLILLHKKISFSLLVFILFPLIKDYR